MPQDLKFDLIVVGAGYAGLVAANRARQLGRSVLVLERGSEAQYACNSRYAGGVLHISYQNLNDAPKDLAAAVNAITGEGADPALVKAVSEHALRTVRWLEEEGVQHGPVGNIGWRQFILSPPRPPVTRLHCWEGKGADLGLRRLEENFTRRAGVVQRGARVSRLLLDGGRCVGVVADRDGVKTQYRGDAVLLADGGFQANPELVGKYISVAPQKLKQRCALTGTGDGLRMAQDAGADTPNLNAFYGHLLSRDAMSSDELWPYPMVDELAAACIVVDGQGRRFADEGLGGVYLANAVARLADPASASVVFDEAAWQGPGRASGIPPNPRLVENGGTLYCADTLAELAAKMGVPAQALAASVAAYNEALATGREAALTPGRSTHRYDPRPICTGPYYAVPICAGITFTMGGIRIDGHGRVLRADGSVLSGLYAAGSTTGGLDGGTTCGYVGGLIKAMVFGLLAGEHVAGEQACAGRAA